MGFLIFIVGWVIFAAVGAGFQYADDVRSFPGQSRLRDYRRSSLVSAWAIGLVGGPISILSVLAGTGAHHGWLNPFRIAPEP